eukprot:TRINITY_DN27451_c0_g1_i1.p1 TRINITY_DN27451_c0_g1~~TRINITY_DN27451_c0_g1_i1.p1  ORF type:complete len:122 (+),score=55.11 TRINITY_DN27451_c0_g1_i1:57-422(+)
MGENEDFLEKTLNWWMENDNLSDKLDKFCGEHCMKFDEAEDGSIPEQTNELYELFLQYKEILEDELEKYLAHEEVSVDEFYKMCALASEDDHASSIIGWILASTEYDSFYRSMLDEKRSKQ